MGINEALATIQTEADKLTAAFHTKDYSKARASVWVGYGTQAATIFIDAMPAEFGNFLYGDDLAALITEAHARLAALPDRHAADAWFDPAHPMNQPEAQAAE